MNCRSPWIAALLLASTAAQAEPRVDASEIYAGLIEDHAIELASPDDLAPLYEAIGKRRFVLLGEASHGTHEYYAWRDRITRQLVEHKDFNFVAVEGDWQAIRRLNDYVTHRIDHDDGVAGLMREITRWPEWLWANEEFAAFCEWLREHNEGLEPDDRVGLYGLDLQDPTDSATAVLSWIAEHNGDGHERVKAAYQRFFELPDGFDGYAQHLADGGERLDDQARLAVAVFDEAAPDRSAWQARRNAIAVARFEHYIHDAVREGGTAGWNRRVDHFHDTVLAIASRYGEGSRGMAWAHNTHVGDARATAMHVQGQRNIGQLLRQDKQEEQVFIVGFSTHRGEVMAGREQGATREVFELPAAREGSVGALLQAHAPEQALLLFGDEFRQRKHALPLEQRAVGITFDPGRQAYVPTLLPWRYDALIHIDETSALTPLTR
jgi:erythromycin esterase